VVRQPRLRFRRWRPRRYARRAKARARARAVPNMCWPALGILAGSEPRQKRAANSPLSLRPTELADGLALKELRYGQVIASRDCLDRFAPPGGGACRPLVPPFPARAPYATDGDSAGLFEAREYNGVPGRVSKCSFVTRSAANWAFCAATRPFCGTLARHLRLQPRLPRGRDRGRRTAIISPPCDRGGPPRFAFPRAHGPNRVLAASPYLWT
jgi:hypothetical protein